MKLISGVSLSFLVLASYCFYSITAIGLLGIDFGTKFVKTAIARPGTAFEIVLNEASKRKTENIIGFKDNHVYELKQKLNEGAEEQIDLDPLDALVRLFGNDASVLYSKSPERAINNILSYLGGQSSSLNKVSDPELDEALRLVTKYQVEENFVLVEGIKFPVEELIGMYLEYVSSMAEAFSGEEKLRDVVLVVPSGLDPIQRKSLLLAAELADLNVMSFITENTAAALNFASNRQDVASGDTESNLILFANMGNSNLQVSLFSLSFVNASSVSRYSKKNDGGLTPVVKVIAEESLPYGSEVLDVVVKDELLTDFLDAHSMTKDDLLNEEGFLRIDSRFLQKAKKVKEVLSANEKIPVSIESVLEGKDLRTEFSRERLERASKSVKLGSLVTRTVQRLLEKAGKTADEVNIIELVGGGTRTPLIKNALSVALGDQIELATHLNGDEAMAMGAVYRAANLSKTFRVKNVHLTDITGLDFSVDLKSSTEEGWYKNSVLFESQTPVGSRKALTFQHPNDVIVNSFFSKEEGEGKLYSSSRLLIESFSKKLEGMNTTDEGPKIVVTFELNNYGFADIVKAEAFYTQLVQKKVKVKKSNDTDSESVADPSEVENASASENATVEEPVYEIKIVEKKKKMKITVINEKSDLISTGLSTNDMVEASQRLRKFKKLEKARQEHELERNLLESFIFSSRDKIRSLDGIEEVVYEEELEGFFEFLTEVEDWLFEDEADICVPKLFREKRRNIDKKTKAILKRLQEYTLRETTVLKADKLIEKFYSKIESAKVERDWIPEAAWDDFKASVDSFKQWLEEAKVAQSKLDKKEEPAFYLADIQQKLEPLQYKYLQILKIKKPKEDEVASETETEEGADSEDNEESEEESESAEEEAEIPSEGAPEEPADSEEGAEDPENDEDYEEELEERSEDSKDEL